MEGTSLMLTKISVLDQAPTDVSDIFYLML